LRPYLDETNIEIEIEVINGIATTLKNRSFIKDKEFKVFKDEVSTGF